AALGTDIVVGTAPATRSGSAASMSETVQELGIAVGVALLGSLTTAVSRTQVPVPGDLAPATAHALTDSLSAAVTVAETLPTGALSAAQEAFTTGLNVASLVACTTVAAACVLCLVRLRHVPRLGQQPPETEG